MDYAKRAYELGHRVITCMEHGYQGNYLKLWSLAESKEFHEAFGDYPFKLVFGAEAYWVPDRLNKEDSSNRHICVFARNESGRRQITKMLTIANEDGFYRVPRVDLSLLMNLRPQDVLVTTACVSFWGKIPRGTQDLVWFDGIDDAFSMLAKHFGDSLYLEVQAHDSKWQRDVNAHALTLRDQYHVRLIAGMDSHYITPEQKQIRSWLREENGREINSEEGDHAFESCVYEDYPDESELRARFARQGILFQEAIDEAIESTDIFLTFDDLHFTKEKKLPNIYPDRTQEERNEMYLQLLRDAWKEYRKTIPRELWSRYEKAIIEEAVDTVVATNMSDYFLIDHALVEEAIRNGGEITKTGRGSGGSFFTNTLLGFSTLDRLSLPVTLYPSRFISKERLQAGSLPDLDMNVSDPEPFAAAQQKVMGEGHSYPMISYKPLKLKSAFRLFARVRNLPMELQNEISTQLDKYEKELRYAEDPDEVDVFDFVDEQYRDVIEGCRVYEGIIVSKSQAPCGYLIYDGDIRSEIGLVRVTSDTKKTSVLCTVIDGAMADLYGYLKNDILTVSVVKVNNQVMRECGVGQISAKELIELTKDDPATWEVFHKGWTVGINQCEREASRRKIVTYKPNNLTELSAFIAAIRPAFKSNLKQFLHREHFEYGIPALDHLLQTPEMPDSWILYQEQMMKVIAFAGFPLDETYSIVKAISKKHPEKVLPLKEKFLKGFSERVMQEDGVPQSEADNAAEKVWQIISDACAYGFNASHAAAVALDAMYGAYLKSHYPLHYYRVLMETRSLKKDKEEANAAKTEMRDAYHIRLVPCKFGEDNRTFSIDPERNVIVDAMMSVKGLSLSTAKAMYEAGKHAFRTFTDFLIYNDQHKCLDSGKLDTLITIGYFSRFGNAKTLRHIADLFSTTFKSGHAKEISRAKVDGSPVGEIISMYSTCVRKDGSPASSYTIRDMSSILYACEEWVFSLRYEDDSIREKIMTQTDLMGYTDVVTGKEEDRRKLVILDLFPLRSKNSGDVWAYKLTTQSIGSGKQSQITLRRAKYDQKPVKQYDVIDVYSCPKDKKGYFELLSYSIVKEDRL